MTNDVSSLNRDRPPVGWRKAVGAWALAGVLVGWALPVTAQETVDAVEAAPADVSTPPASAPESPPESSPESSTESAAQVSPADSPEATTPLPGPVGVTRANGGALLLNFQDAPLDLVLDELSRAAGFIVVKEVQPTTRVTLLSRQAATPEEAVVLLNTVLHQAGYAAIQQDRILKIVDRDRAKRANIPVHTGSDPELIARTDQLITQVIPLRYASAPQLHQDLGPLVNPEADFASNASSNALVITDTSANIRRVVEIVRALDTSLAGSIDVRVFQLRYANASTAAQLINSVFEEHSNIGGDPATQGPPGESDAQRRRRIMQQAAMRARGGQQTPQAASTTRVRAAADERTNMLVVTAPTDLLPVVERVLDELDADPAAEVMVFVYSLKNAQAINAEGVLNSLFGGGGAAGTAGRGQTQQQQSGVQGRNTRTGGTRTIGGAAGGRGGTAQRTTQIQGRFGGTTTGRSGAVSATARNTAADLAGQVTVIADPDTNSLLVRTSPNNYERVQQVIAELDRTAPQVLIKVLIAEVTHDNDLDLGVEFSALNLRPSGLGQTVGTDFGVAAATGGMVVQILEQDFNATLRALEIDGKLEVLSRPYILASDNQLASIVVGQEIPFITNSRTTDSGQIINTIEYGDVGILLDVIPHINPDGLVILEVAPEISALTGVTVPINEVVSLPVIAKRSAQTRVSVQNGQTVVIGGLMEDRRTDTIHKVPLLGDIPLLGELFKRRRQNKVKTELLIFLTPHVAVAPEDLTPLGEQELERTRLVPDAVRPGEFERHREGMQHELPERPTERREPRRHEFRFEAPFVPQGEGAPMDDGGGWDDSGMIDPVE